MEVDTDTSKINRLAKNARLEARVTIEQKQLLERDDDKYRSDFWFDLTFI